MGQRRQRLGATRFVMPSVEDKEKREEGREGEKSTEFIKEESDLESVDVDRRN